MAVYLSTLSVNGYVELFHFFIVTIMVFYCTLGMVQSTTQLFFSSVAAAANMITPCLINFCGIVSRGITEKDNFL